MNSELSATKINLGGYQPPSSIHNRAAEIFGKELNRRLGPLVRYQMDGNMAENGGIKAFDLPRLVETGDLTMCYFASSYLVNRVPEAAVFDVPFLVQNREKIYTALEGELGDLLRDKFLRNMGVRILGFWDNGFRHFTNGIREIRTPADCVNLKMRSMNSAAHQEFFRLLGFEPAFIDVADLVEKIKLREIDAQENPLTNTYRFGTHRYHKYITMTGHFFGVALLMVNNKIYSEWPATTQQAVLASANIATDAQRRFAQTEDVEVLSALKPNDNAIAYLSDDELKLFKDAVQPLVDRFRASLGSHLFRLVE
jgi:TRAP-type C4-dicarboxylate transport system substrate-binding protein